MENLQNAQNSTIIYDSNLISNLTLKKLTPNLIRTKPKPTPNKPK